ncbi:MAG: hypothetical protein Phog2KO_17950 [Phototrophicaceae bacterium]
MRVSRKNRLKQIEDILWNSSAPLTVKQIIEILGLNSQSYISSLLKELERAGKVYSQPSIPNSRLKVYQPIISNIGQIPTNLPFNTPLYKPLDNWDFDNDHCFLCGLLLSDDNRSEEHIFPKWLQRRYDLFNMELDLLNGTPMPYKSLKIPCCKNCNGIYLSNMESRIQQAHDAGFEAFSKLPRILIFQWLAKIFYGLLFRELFLNLDRTNPADGKIFEVEQIKMYDIIHQFLQSVRMPFSFVSFQPWSIFVVRILNSHKPSNFMWDDDIYHAYFAIRMGEIGIIACLEDGGIQQKSLQHYFKDASQLVLHPIQFAELCAKFHHRRKRLNRGRTYFTRIPKNIGDGFKVFMSSVGGLSKKPIFDEFNGEDYAYYLLHHLRIFPIPSNYILDNAPIGLTWIYNEEGKLCQFDIEMKTVDLIESLLK